MGNVCCADAKSRENEESMLRDQISRSVVNTEGPMATMEDEQSGDNTGPETPEKGILASEKHQKI